MMRTLFGPEKIRRLDVAVEKLAWRHSRPVAVLSATRRPSSTERACLSINLANSALVPAAVRVVLHWSREPPRAPRWLHAPSRGRVGDAAGAAGRMGVRGAR